MGEKQEILGGAGMIKKYLKAADVAKEYGFAVDTLTMWRKMGKGPRYIKLAGCRDSIRYERTALENWLDSQVVLTTDDYLQPAARQ